MKRITKNIVLLLLLTLISCKEQKSTKTYLANYVDSIKTKYSISENPLVIIDGYTEEYELMNDGGFLLLKEDIVKTEYLKKENAEKIYGEIGKYGVVLVTTILSKVQNRKIDSDKKTLYVLDGEIISVDEYNKIDKSKIIGIGTITDKNAIKEFSKEEYDEVIYISTKMPTE